MTSKNLIALLLTTLFSTTHATSTLEEQGCRPVIDATLPQFIIGYGSLMNEKSKKEDGPDTGDNMPVNISGFARGWIEHSTDSRFGTTYLGVKPKADAKMNAVYFKLHAATDLQNYDQRENTYCRIKVPQEKIEQLTGTPLPAGEYWIYTSLADDAIPSEQYPLVQSYVDLFLTGCMELEKKHHLSGFARKCVTTTGQWSGSWVNDRLYPRTAVDNIPYAGEIDGLIKDALPQYYNLIKIE